MTYARRNLFPQEVTGQPFDDLMRKIVKVKTDKPKKKSRPAKLLHVTPDFAKAELLHKRVQFEIVEGEITWSGIGWIDATQPDRDGPMSVTIHANMVPVEGVRRERVFPLTQPMVDCLTRHADAAVADFRLVFP